MPVFDLTINVIVLFLLMVMAALAGFALRSRQLAKKNRQIVALEKELLMLSAEILQVQKEYCDLELTLKDMNIPVISIRQAAVKEDASKKDGRTA
jgi:hypothetical protein